MNAIWQRWMLKPSLLLQVVFSVFLFFDAYFGLIHNKGIITSLGLLTGEIKWLTLFVEMMAGILLLVRIILNQIDNRWKSTVIIFTPIIVTLVGFVVLDFLLTGLGRSATLNFNLSSLGSSGLYWSAVYISIAIGLTITYKVQRFANFAQAEMMLFGAYVALTLMWSDRFFPISNAPKDGSLNWELIIWSGISAFIITGIIGLIIDKVVYKRFRNKMATPQVMMIASLGVSMVLRAILYMRFSASTHRFIPDRDWRLSTATFEIPTKQLQLHLGDRINAPLVDIVGNVNSYGFAYSKVALVVGIFGAIILLLFILHRTSLGRQMRAVADNSDLAASSGIHVERVHGSTAFLSSGISGLGGALLAAILPINPELGLTLLLPAFAIIVLGTIGSIPGVIIGSLIIGLLRATSEPVLIGAGNALDRPTATGFAEVMPFIFLIGLLLLAPRGIGSAIQDWNIKRIRKKRLSQQNKKSPNPQLNKVFILLNPLSDTLSQAIIYIYQVKQVINILMELIKKTIKTYSGLLKKCTLKLLAKIKFTGPSRTDILSGLRIKPSNWVRIKRETERGSWITFAILFLLLACIVWILPSVTTLTKVLQVARIITLVSIFSLACFSLNLHTGLTGMTNFGVIFFVGIGAVVVGLLSAPVATNGYGWNPFMATIVAVIISATIGWLLAYPTARLRMDYFAIVTIALGEVLRISLQAEPLLRAGTTTSAMGISQFSRPLESWWENGPSEMVGNLLGLNISAPYVVFLSIISALSVIVVWFLLNTVLVSPWGRILRSIRDDEIVSQHHGHNILIHKAASLALGAAIAALAGALWAWLNTNVWPDFMNPVRTTFLIWAAFIVGGRGNNRGMIIGAFLIVIVEFIFNVMVVSRGSASLPFHNMTSYLDNVFSWLILNVGGIIWSDRSITEIFPKGDIILSLPHLKLALIGVVIVGTLLTSSKGLLPEVPSRPKRPSNSHSNLDKEGSSK